MNFDELVAQYIDSKKFSWARTSKKNERYRLLLYGSQVIEDPETVYKNLTKTMNAYSIKTTLTRLGQFHEYLVDEEKIPIAKNPWKKFLKKNAMLFKHAYQLERVKTTFAEARPLILTMEYQYMMASRQLLEGGLRYCELHTLSADGETVIGKGGKPRKVFLSPELKLFHYTGSYSALFVRLKVLGLKPHTLRKLWATEISRHPDMKDQDICKLGGWSSIETSIKYRQPHNDQRLGEMINSVVERAMKVTV